MTTQSIPLSPDLSNNAMEHRARRAAKRVGLVARKTRWRANTTDNFGGFMLVDAQTNCVVSGTRFDLSAEEVIAWCAESVE